LISSEHFNLLFDNDKDVNVEKDEKVIGNANKLLSKYKICNNVNVYQFVGIIDVNFVERKLIYCNLFVFVKYGYTPVNGLDSILI
jgi:hypothetical protein